MVVLVHIISRLSAILATSIPKMKPKRPKEKNSEFSNENRTRDPPLAGLTATAVGALQQLETLSQDGANQNTPEYTMMNIRIEHYFLHTKTEGSKRKNPRTFRRKPHSGRVRTAFCRFSCEDFSTNGELYDITRTNMFFC